ncbi:MAG: glycosyl transferase family 1, partial [Candidatus Limnocylindrales bacterium]
ARTTSVGPVAERAVPYGERPTPPLAPLPGVVRTHLDELTGALGIYQHARGRLPDPGQGYCTDDVARAALVDILHGQQLGRPAVVESLERSVQFLSGAVVPRTSRMRNFRDDDGNWLEREGSPDAHARAIQALGVICGDHVDDPSSRSAGLLLEEILPVSLELTGLRPWAHVVLGCVAASAGRRIPGSARIVLVELTGRLFEAFEATDPAWPWPEPRVTYENAILAQALLEGGDQLNDPAMVERGLATLDWLLNQQVSAAGHLELIGNKGWWQRDQEPVQFDQQPIDAASIVDACAAAWRVTGRAAWLTEMERAYAWFLGSNAVGIAVAEPDRGGCGDGLNAVGVSANQGAESTLAWLAAVERVRTERVLEDP